MVTLNSQSLQKKKSYFENSIKIRFDRTQRIDCRNDFIDFDQSSRENVMGAIDELKASDCVILIQSEAFYLDKYRLKNKPKSTFCVQDIREKSTTIDFGFQNPHFISPNQKKKNKLRIRIELFKRSLKTIEHVHLFLIPSEQFRAYINSLAFNPKGPEGLVAR